MNTNRTIAETIFNDFVEAFKLNVTDKQRGAAITMIKLRLDEHEKRMAEAAMKNFRRAG